MAYPRFDTTATVKRKKETGGGGLLFSFGKQREAPFLLKLAEPLQT